MMVYLCRYNSTADAGIFTCITNLNVLFFDACALWRKQFNFICQQSQYLQLSVIGSPQTITLLGSSMIKAPANGYVYIYVSNESRNPVYIDNFLVLHQPGRIEEETHYYPFGLIQEGISSKAATTLENKHKYNGKELQSKEFSDGSGVEWLDFGARMYDNQIGRWHVLDPLASKFPYISPYTAFNNNPLRFKDPTGMEPEDWILSVGSKVYWYGGNVGDKSNLIATFNAKSGNTPHKDGDADKNYQFGKYQKVRDMGPTTEGQYLINLKPSFDRVAKAGSDGELVRSKQGGVEKIPDEVPIPGDKENVWTYENWGTNRAYLSPVKVTGATSKDRDITSFYLHDSEKGYTHGCTEVQTELFDKLAEYKKAGNEKIDVIVQYPDKNASTNGRKKKTP
ncbi:MAG: hypothetical protein IT254_07365 [Chitinophagaceae bacterium]|nr:hypothetical protein [Bacteroidota bacterium]MCC6258122.1 hypothetical protein [Chitinophagaceae bacterium]